MTSGAVNLSFFTQFWSSDFSAMSPKLEKQDSWIFEHTGEQAGDFSALLALISGLAPDFVECLSCAQGSPGAGKNDSQSAAYIGAVVLCGSTTHVGFSASKEAMFGHASALLSAPERAISETKEVATLSDKPEYEICQTYGVPYEQFRDVDLAGAEEITANYPGASPEDDLGFKHTYMQEQGLAKEAQQSMDQYSDERISELQTEDSMSSGEMEKGAAQYEANVWIWPGKEMDSKVVNFYDVITNQEGDAQAGERRKNDELNEEHLYSGETTHLEIDLGKSGIPKRISFVSANQAQSLGQENVSNLAEPNRTGIGNSSNSEEAVKLSTFTNKWFADGEADADSVLAVERGHLQSEKTIDFLKEQARSVQVQETVEGFESMSGSMLLKDVEGHDPEYDLDAIGTSEDTLLVDLEEVKLAAEGAEPRSKQNARDELSKGQSLKGPEVIEATTKKTPIADDGASRSALLEAERSGKSAGGSGGQSVYSTDEGNKVVEMPPFPSGASVKETASTTDQLPKGAVFNITYSEMAENVKLKVPYQEHGAADDTARMSQDQFAKNVIARDQALQEAKQETDETLFVDGNALETQHSREEVSGQRPDSSGAAFEQQDVQGAKKSLWGKAEKQSELSKGKAESSAVQRVFESLPRSLEDVAHQDISSSLRPEWQHSPGKLVSDATNVKLPNETFLEQKSSLAMQLAELPLRFGIDVRGGELLLTIMANSDQDASYLKQHSGYVKQRLARKGYEFDAVNVVNNSQATVQDYRVYHYDMVV